MTDASVPLCGASQQERKQHGACVLALLLASQRQGTTPGAHKQDAQNAPQAAGAAACAVHQPRASSSCSSRAPARAAPSAADPAPDPVPGPGAAEASKPGLAGGEPVLAPGFAFAAFPALPGSAACSAAGGGLAG